MDVSEFARQETSSSSVMDRREFTRRFEQVYRQLWILATSIIQDRDLAEDLVQEAAMIAYRKLPTFQVGTNFTAWMAEIVRRCAWNHQKKTRGRATFPSDPFVMDAAQIAATVIPQAINEVGELSELQEIFDDRIVAVLQTLSHDARACLLLRIVEQLSYSEISEIMGIPPGTAMSHVHRSKAVIRTRLTHLDRPPQTRSD